MAENFYVKGNAQIILNQLRVLTKLVSPKEGNIALQVHDANLYMYSMNDIATYQSLIPCDEVKGDVTVGVSVEALRTILSGRKDVVLEVINGMFTISAGKYKAEISTVDAVEVQSIAEKLASVKNEKMQTWNVDVEHSKWLKNAISDVQLRVPDSLATFMPLTIRLNDKGAFVICYDVSHLSFIMAKADEISGNLDVTMPTDMLSSVFESFYGNKFKMMASESTLIVKSKLLTITMQLPVTDSYIDVTNLLEVSKSSIKNAGEWVKVNRASVIAFLDSCKAVASKERSEIVVSAKGTKCNFMVHTVNGNVTQVFELTEKANVQFKIDFSYFDEAFRKGNSEIAEFKVIADSSLVIGGKNKNAWSVVSLNGD